MRATIDRVLTTLGDVGAPATWVFENHDVTRLPTRYGGGELGRRRARAAALLLFGLPGAAFAYQGQELGLEEVDVPDDSASGPDLPSHRRRPEGARRLPCAAALDDGAADVRLHRRRAVAADAPRTGGRSASRRRSATPTRRSRSSAPRSACGRAHDRFAWRESPRGTMIFDRGDLTCLVNVDASELELPDGELLLASEPGITTTLPPNTAAWVRKGTT